MVTVNERWVIQIDGLNYTVCQNKPKEETKDGKTYVTYPARAYCRTLADALKWCADEEVRNSLLDGDKTLLEAVATVRKVRKDMHQMINRILQEEEE